jgi:hypothetical protein
MACVSFSPSRLDSGIEWRGGGGVQSSKLYPQRERHPPPGGPPPVRQPPPALLGGGKGASCESNNKRNTNGEIADPPHKSEIPQPIGQILCREKMSPKEAAPKKAAADSKSDPKSAKTDGTTGEKSGPPLAGKGAPEKPKKPKLVSSLTECSLNVH